MFSIFPAASCYTVYMTQAKKTHKFRKIWIAAVIVVLIVILLSLAVNGYVTLCAKERILDADTACAQEFDCILVLGAGVWGEGENAYPSHMLEDRLKTALELYRNGAAPKLLMSGDHGRKNYDEVNVMKAYAVDNGVPSEDVFMDHAGFSTYESMYRARDVFQAKRLLIVTQEYHLYRAVYVARALGLDAYGVSASLRPYVGQQRYNMREMFARIKDFFTAIFQPKPKYLGDAIPVWGDGNLTND